MRDASLWRALLGLDQVVVEDVELDEETGVLVASVRPKKGAARPRCGICGKRAPRYDRGEGSRRWRALDLGTILAYVEAEAPRVSCSDHGVVVAQVPWARHGAGHTRAFDDQVAWLVTHTSKSAVVELMRIAWRTVGAIVTRVVADGRAAHDPFSGLTRIGIDEISYKKGHRYLTVVVDHDSGRLIWAAPGRDRATLSAFFDELGEARCGEISLVSADAAEWIASVVTERCPNATLCADAFHVVKWATEALDEVRREVWNEARKAGGDRVAAARLKGCRYALWKNPDRLTRRQRTKLAWVAHTNSGLYRAYLLKEELRLVFALKGEEGSALLDHWLAWASRCRIPSFVALAKRIRAHRGAIEATLTHRLSNALVESTNTKLRLLTRIAFGFRSAEALVALALLDRGGYCPPLPGRAR
ncbi:MAG: ISL3 family transposase [Acidimicrobiales bacterium]